MIFALVHPFCRSPGEESGIFLPLPPEFGLVCWWIQPKDSFVHRHWLGTNSLHHFATCIKCHVVQSYNSSFETLLMMYICTRIHTLIWTHVSSLCSRWQPLLFHPPNLQAPPLWRCPLVCSWTFWSLYRRGSGCPSAPRRSYPTICTEPQLVAYKIRL